MRDYDTMDLGLESRFEKFNQESGYNLENGRLEGSERSTLYSLLQDAGYKATTDPQMFA